MAANARLSELKRKHTALEGQLHEVKLHPSIEGKAIIDLKRKKLAIKDEMNKLSVSA